MVSDVFLDDPVLPSHHVLMDNAPLNGTDVLRMETETEEDDAAMANAARIFDDDDDGCGHIVVRRVRTPFSDTTNQIFPR